MLLSLLSDVGHSKLATTARLDSSWEGRQPVPPLHLWWHFLLRHVVWRDDVRRLGYAIRGRRAIKKKKKKKKRNMAPPPKNHFLWPATTLRLTDRIKSTLHDFKIQSRKPLHIVSSIFIPFDRHTFLNTICRPGGLGERRLVAQSHFRTLHA